jgi:inosine-uridine nucleoside N-ribohydrolase
MPLRLFFLSLVACSLASAQPKLRVLLDTDAFNEIDDQFFVAWSFFEKRLEIEGVAAAHYRWENGSVDESYYEVHRVLELMRVTPKIPIVRGADYAMKDDKSPLQSAATNLIHTLAAKQDARPLYVLAVGALTNVASAILLHPEIKQKIKVVWLGGYPPDGRIVEFNAANDRAAVKSVFESGVDLTVVPTETCARYLTLPYDEANSRLRHTNVLGRYLLGLVRDYGDRNKIIWDISVTAYALQIATRATYFDVNEEPAPTIDLAQAKYIRGQGPHKIKVCSNARRDAIFSAMFRHLPAPVDRDAPYPLLATASEQNREVRVWFSEPVKALDRANFQVAANGIQDVQMLDEQTAVVRLQRPVQGGAEITVSGGADPAGNAMLDGRHRVTIRSAGNAKPGLRLKAYFTDRGQKEVPNPQGQPAFDGVVPTLAWPSLNLPAEIRKPDQGTLLIAEGLVCLPLDHRYEFDLVAHKYARVYLDGRLLLDQSMEGDRRARRTTFRRAGVYPIRVEQYVEPGRFDLTLQWNLPFHDMSLIPGAALLHE